MADKHTSGDGRNGLYDSSPGLKVHTAEGSTEEETEDQNLWPRLLARKWVLMLFIGTCLLYCARMAMPICAVSLATSFHWSKIDSGLVLGGFFWGYCFTQILGGLASDKVGGERVLFISAVSWSVVTAATPLVAHLGSHTVALMTMARFLMGLLQGVFYPSLASLCSQRVLEAERGFLMSTINGGSNLGILLAGAMGSLMLDRYGWESMFYCIGYSVASVRKLMQFFCMGISSVFILLLCGDVSFTTAVTFISLSIGLGTFSSGGVSVNVQDLCPSCAGAIYGLVLVSVSGYLIEVTTSWTSVFSLITLVNAAGLGIFIIFGDARRVDLGDYKQVV
ncbi:Solute carrier family 17 member 9 [Liparis tanakae]|uniref:Solute carrier family 17 member 9 n=1 Tax=Liparis tanakae TaxID=230148 RepID=A0A4Z2I749_9TELE|nr:Solute carrier family 17 member 9 [Liparis tanakae]